MLCILTLWQNFLGINTDEEKKKKYILISVIRSDKSEIRKLFMLIDVEPTYSWQKSFKSAPRTAGKLYAG